ncbi:hypothetical protein ACU4GR_05195 [Methylobacterium oryzae CBMB20]
MRGYDTQTGEVLWTTKLPAGGQATPMTYRGRDDRQYVVIAAGGHGALGHHAGRLGHRLPARVSRPAPPAGAEPACPAGSGP